MFHCLFSFKQSTSVAGCSNRKHDIFCCSGIIFDLELKMVISPMNTLRRNNKNDGRSFNCLGWKNLRQCRTQIPVCNRIERSRLHIIARWRMDTSIQDPIQVVLWYRRLLKFTTITATFLYNIKKSILILPFALHCYPIYYLNCPTHLPVHHFQCP